MCTALCTVVIGGAVVGCGSSDGGSTDKGAAAAATKGSGSLNGDGKKIVFFDLSKSFPYIAAQQKAAQEEAARLGFKLQIIENTLDADKQNTQIQQYLATGEVPAAFVWLPVDPGSQVNPLRQMARSAPVFQVDAQIEPFADEYVTAYAGIDGIAKGRSNGEAALEVRAKDRKSGRKLHDPAGNLLYLNMPKGFRLGELQDRGWNEATKGEPFKLLRAQDSGIGAQPGYETTSQLIPKYKAQGIDYIFATNVDTANGVVRALKESGLRPGKDVKVIAGNCAGDMSAVINGEIANCGIESGASQGKLVIDQVAQYLATGKVVPGEKQLPASREAPTVKVEPPTRSTYIPYPRTSGRGILEDCRLWGVACLPAAGATS